MNLCKFTNILLKLDELILDCKDIKGNTGHYIETEMFVYLHNGKDYCNCFMSELYRIIFKLFILPYRKIKYWIVKITENSP